MKFFEKQLRIDFKNNLFPKTDTQHRKKRVVPFPGGHKHRSGSIGTTYGESTEPNSFRKPFSNHKVQLTLRIKDRMKLFSRKTDDSQKTKVSRVRIMAERPRAISHSLPQPSNEIPKDVPPPSPTCVKEQAQFDATVVSSEEKEAPIEEKEAPIPSGTFSKMTCNSSPIYCKGNLWGDWNHSETTERLEEWRKMMNTKMEFVHGKIFGNLGESAMTAVEKNRDEMDRMIGKIDTESRVVYPVNWLTEKTDGPHNGPIMTCNDVKSCLPASQETYCTN